MSSTREAPSGNLDPSKEQKFLGENREILGDLLADEPEKRAEAM
ncbi:MAG: hypothetical protein WC777_04380 [Candidatus Gracilibacteria bacterium]|jgi:hypothetical protein